MAQRIWTEADASRALASRGHFVGSSAKQIEYIPSKGSIRCAAARDFLTTHKNYTAVIVRED